MKFALAIIVGLLTTQAKAMVHIPGSFQPSACGEQSYEAQGDSQVKIQDICIGTIIGEAKSEKRFDAVRFSFDNQKSLVYRVSNVVELHEALPSETQYLYELKGQNGERLTVLVKEDVNGSISLAGRVGTIDYFVKDLEQVMVLMGSF